MALPRVGSLFSSATSSISVVPSPLAPLSPLVPVSNLRMVASGALPPVVGTYPTLPALGSYGIPLTAQTLLPSSALPTLNPLPPIVSLTVAPIVLPSIVTAPQRVTLPKIATQLAVVAEPAVIELVRPDFNAKITITVYENKIKFFTDYFLEKQLLAAKGQAMDRNRLRYYAQSLSLPVKQMNKAPLQQAIEADAREYNFRL